MRHSVFLAVVFTVIILVLMFSCQSPFSNELSTNPDPDEYGGDTPYIFDGHYSEDFPIIKRDVLYDLNAGTIESDVFEKIGCAGKIIGSGRLIVGYKLEEGGKARLFFDPVGSRELGMLNRFQLTRVEVLTDDWELVKTVFWWTGPEK